MPHSAGSAIRSDGSLTLINSTFSKNFGEAALGILARGGVVRVNHCTFSDNRGGAIKSARYPGTNLTYAIEIRNCILSGNIDPHGEPLDVIIEDNIQPTITHTIIGAVSGEFVDKGNNQIGIDPKLGPFDFHDGSRKTYSLLDGSPGIDAGSSG